MAKTAAKYDEKSIQRLKGLEAVRKKPGMYLGERGDSMVFQSLKEIIDNSVDEFFAGRNKEVFVFADNKAQTYLVADKAQGIPVGMVKEDPENKKSKLVSTLTLIFTELHTGGKFDDKAYKTARGTHGVGAAATNAVSESFEVWTFRDKKWHYQPFKCGKAVAELKTVKSVPSDVKKAISWTIKGGSIVRFKPDQSIVSKDGGKTKAKLDLTFTAKWLKDLAMLNPGISITFSANGKSKTFFNKDGLASLLKRRLDEQELEPMGKPFIFQSETMSVALQWSDYSDDDGVSTYVSSGITRDGGEHEVGLRNALSKALNVFKKKNDKFAPKDLYHGLIGVLDYKMSQAEFSGQTKDRLTSNVAPDVEKQVLPELNKFLAKHKTLARQIIKRAVEVKKSKDDFKKTLDAVSSAKKKSKSSLPGVLVSSPKATPATRELYLVEGDSAAGTAKRARDSAFQEVMRLNGKPANAARMKLHQLLESKAVQNILMAIGYNFDTHKKDNVNGHDKLRINKLFLLPDADVDGDHIAVLILTLIYKLMPSLFKEGKVYIVDAPLFSAYYKGKRYFGENHKAVSKQLPKGAPTNIIMRSKGWGEIGHETLAHIAFDPKSRSVVRVNPIKGKEASYFEKIVGNDSQARKDLLGL